MFNKILFYISATMCICFVMAVIAFTYLTRVGYYNAIFGLVLIVLSIIGAACCGIAAVLFEDIINGKCRKENKE